MYFDFVKSAELSDVGKKRKRNEDSVLRVESHGVFCVADGMGGADAGDIASSATVREIGEGLKRHTDNESVASSAAKCRIVCESLCTANEWIKERSSQRGRGMSGSTVAVLVLDAITPDMGVCIHAGDSRVYRFRKNQLEQITRDHSIAEAAGFKDRSKVPKTFRGVVTRAIGIETELHVEETPVDVAADDLFLLCSDGLSSMLSDRKIRKILRSRGRMPLDELAAKLVEQANRKGGEDNISVVLVDVGNLEVGDANDIRGNGLDQSEEQDGTMTTQTAQTPVTQAVDG